MIELNFGPDAGGKRYFEDYECLCQFLDGEIEAWQSDMEMWTPLSMDEDSHAYVHLFVYRWKEYKTDAERLHRDQGGASAEFVSELQGVIRQAPAISRSSSKGAVLRRIAVSSSPLSAKGAAKMLVEPKYAQIFSNMQKGELDGVLDLWAYSRSLDPHAANAARQVTCSPEIMPLVS